MNEEERGDLALIDVLFGVLLVGMSVTVLAVLPRFLAAHQYQENQITITLQSDNLVADLRAISYQDSSALKTLQSLANSTAQQTLAQSLPALTPFDTDPAPLPQAAPPPVAHFYLHSFDDDARIATGDIRIQNGSQLIVVPYNIVQSTSGAADCSTVVMGYQLPGSACQ